MITKTATMPTTETMTLTTLMQMMTFAAANVMPKETEIFLAPTGVFLTVFWAATSQRVMSVLVLLAAVHSLKTTTLTVIRAAASESFWFLLALVVKVMTQMMLMLMLMPMMRLCLVQQLCPDDKDVHCETVIAFWN